jgi:hypothetical protein
MATFASINKVLLVSPIPFVSRRDSLAALPEKDLKENAEMLVTDSRQRRQHAAPMEGSPEFGPLYAPNFYSRPGSLWLNP